MGRPGKDRHFHSSLGYFDQTTIILHLPSPYPLELQTKVREDFTITEMAPINTVLPGESLSRGLRHDCEIFANFRLKLYCAAAARHGHCLCLGRDSSVLEVFIDFLPAVQGPAGELASAAAYKMFTIVLRLRNYRVRHTAPLAMGDPAMGAGSAIL